MKRKLRIFSNIAIIALSVCMFAFGVYAASSVSVTTQGTVTFTATGVYADVSGSVVGMESAPSFTTLKYSASGTPSASDLATWQNVSLVFKDASTPIVFTITIKNNASDRNIDFTLTDNISSSVIKDVVTTETSGNVKKTIEFSEYAYDTTNGVFNVNPTGTGFEGVRDYETITITFEVANANVSSSLEYNFNINLTEQTETPDATTTTDSTLTRNGNLFALSTTVNQGKQLTNYTVTNANYYKEYPYPHISSEKVCSAFLLTGTNVATITPNITNIDTNITFSSSSAQISNDIANTCTINIPLAVNSSSEGLNIIEEVYGWDEGTVKTNVSVIIPNSVEETSFKYSKGLASLTLAESVCYIASLDEYGGFIDCSISSIYIPRYVEDVSTFVRCNNLTTIEVDPLNKKFYSSGNTVLTKDTHKVVAICANSIIPSETTAIQMRSPELESEFNLTIPANVTTISVGAFEYCFGLKSLTFANGSKITEFTDASMFCYTGIKEIDFGDNSSLITIGESVFSQCGYNCTYDEYSNNNSGYYGLVSVRFGENCKVTTIGTNAFYFSDNDESDEISINIPASVTSMDGAIGGCNAGYDWVFVYLDSEEVYKNLSYDTFNGHSEGAIYLYILKSIVDNVEANEFVLQLKEWRDNNGYFSQGDIDYYYYYPTNA